MEARWARANNAFGLFVPDNGMIGEEK
jgi:hypothetical protein